MTPHPPIPSLAAVVKSRRVALGLSQLVLARRVAARGDPTFRQWDVSRLEGGKVRLPHPARLAALAAALDLSPGDLLARSGWVGAETVFPAAATPDPDRVYPIARPPAWMPVSPARDAITPLWTRTARLRALLAAAEQTRHEAQAIMERCAATRERYEHLVRDTPRH